MEQQRGPTKRERREAARAERIERERREAEVAARRRRLGIFGAIMIAAVVVVAIAIALSSNRSKETAGGGGAVAGVSESLDLYKGIPQRGIELGDPSAKTLIVEFVHPKCPVCRDWELSEIPDVVKQYVRTGRARLQMRVMDFATLGPDSVLGGQAFNGAAAQDRLFQFAAVVYHNQGPESEQWVTEPLMLKLAATVPGLDGARMLADGAGVAGEKALAETNALVARLGVGGTPTVFVGRDESSLAKVGATAKAVGDAIAELGG